MENIRISTPLVTPIVTTAVAVGAVAISTARAVVTDSLLNGSGSDWLNTISEALSIESVIHVSGQTLLCVADVTKDTAFTALNVVATAQAFRRCLDEGFVSLDAVTALACGVNAVAALDRAFTAGIGVGIGIASVGIVASGVVTVTTLISRAKQGDVPGVILSGAKLVATIALTGHPVALGVVITADIAYGLYCVYCKHLEDSLLDADYPEPMDEVLERLLSDDEDAIPVG